MPNLSGLTQLYHVLLMIMWVRIWGRAQRVCSCLLYIVLTRGEVGQCLSWDLLFYVVSHPPGSPSLHVTSPVGWAELLSMATGLQEQKQAWVWSPRKSFLLHSVSQSKSAG